MATFYGILAIALWGGLALLSELTKGIPAFQLLFCCFLLSSLLMFIKRACRGTTIFSKPTLTIRQWLIGIYGLLGFHLCYFYAVKLAPAIEVSLISYLWPMLLALMVSSKSAIIFTLTGSLVGFAGVGLIVIDGDTIAFEQQYIYGYLLAGCCAIIWSSYSYLQAKSSGSSADIGWISMAVAILSLILHFILEQGYWYLSMSEWLGVILLGVGPVGGAFYLWDIGLKKGNQRLLASLSYGTPLISSIVLALAGLNLWSENILAALILITTGGLIANGKLFIWIRKIRMAF